MSSAVAAAATDTLVTVAGKELPLSQELLDYYRKKVKEHEREREELLSQMEQVRVSVQEAHNSKWELRKRADEISDLKRALSDAQLAIMDERETVLRLYAENDALKVQETTDRRKIAELLQMVDPMQDEVTYFQDCRPERTVRSHGRRPGTGDNNKNGGNNNAGSDASDGDSVKDQRDSGVRRGSGVRVSTPPIGRDRTSTVPRVMRTVVLPNSKSEEMLRTIESLRAQLEEVSRHANDRYQVMLEDRRVRLEEEAVRANNDRALIAKQDKQLRQLQDLLTHATREHLASYHNTQVILRVLKEENSKLRSQNRRFVRELDQLRAHYEHEALERQVTEEDVNTQYADKFRQEVLRKDEDLAQARASLKQTQAVFAKRVRVLEEKCDLLKRQNTRLNERRHVERQGYQSDVKMLRGELKQLESALLATQQASLAGQGSDKYVAEVMNSALTTGRTANRMAVDLRKLKSKIAEMERKVFDLPV